MKKVLIIAYHFPPDTSIGSLRIKGLSKYLHSFGWEPIILTRNLPNDQSVMNVRVLKTKGVEYDSVNRFKGKIGISSNRSIKNNLKLDQSTKRTQIFSFLSQFVTSIVSYPDNQKDWYLDAFNVASNLFDSEMIDGMISSSGPFTSHLIACNLKKKYGIPWIADLRDLWTQDQYYEYGSLRKVFDRMLERKVLLRSDLITTVSHGYASRLAKLHGNKCVTINNGFDLDEMNISQISLNSKFVITYTGNLWRGKRDPSKLFQSLKELILEGKLSSDDVEVKFYGNMEEWLKNMIKRYELNDIVTVFDFIPRECSYNKQRESQLLLILLWDHPAEVGVLTGKLFEYLAARRPILVIGGNQKGDIYKLLSETNSGVYCSSVDEIKDILYLYYCEYKKNKIVPYNGIESEINKYSQLEMAKKFAKNLDLIS